MSIRTQNLSVSLSSSREIQFPDIDLTIGQSALLTGPSGCGKSTLLNILCGLQQNASGTCEVNGVPVLNLTARQADQFRANSIGLISQTLDLISYLSAYQNVQLGVQFQSRDRKDQTEVNPDELFERLGLSDANLNGPVSKLSIGQQQRVAVARALAGKPTVILADEPTSALDPASTDAFMRLLKDNLDPNSQTLLMVSHDHSLAQHMEQTIGMPAC